MQPRPTLAHFLKLLTDAGHWSETPPPDLEGVSVTVGLRIQGIRIGTLVLDLASNGEFVVSTVNIFTDVERSKVLRCLSATYPADVIDIRLVCNNLPAKPL